METNEQFLSGVERLSRRAALTTATAAAGFVAGMSAARAEIVPAATGFGAPLAELHFPAGALSVEQKAAMIKGVTEVLVKVTKLAPDDANKLWVQIFETAEGGWGRGGQVFVPRGR
jgi:phenylpyruvate tautomerase PptA (4-oxalocrotonate tautomerase family)